MDIHSILSALSSPVIQPVEKHGQDAKAAEKKLYLAAMTMYMNELHLLIMSSWEKFATNRKEMAHRACTAQKALEEHAALEKGRRIEAERREKELRVQSDSVELLHRPHHAV
jgi:hypothetical protein